MRSQERIGTLVLVALIAAWPLTFVFLLNRTHYSAHAAPAYVVFFVLFWLIWLVLLVLLIRSAHRELSKALEQKTATAEILRAISTSPTTAQPVFETIVRNAVNLCGSQFANVFRFDGEFLHFAASHNVGPDYEEMLRTKYPMRPDASQVSGRVLLTKSVVRLEDAVADPDYDQRFPQALGWRRMMGVPMIREGRPMGVIVVGWAQPGPIPAAQEDLLKTFADQAVIAIENARLFNDVQTRTGELSEALEYQTATSEVLNVISRSPTQLQPVLDAIVQTAARLCSAEYSFITRYSEDKCYLVAANRVEAAHVQYLSQHPVLVDRGSVTGRVALERRTFHIADVLNDPEFNRLEWQKVGKQRTVLGVPLLREGSLIGVMILARTEVEPFTQKQIELVTTFANQAVIAIENARLFDEAQARTHDLSESLRQQTATADVLKVISRSTFDLQTVLDTLVEAAARLCEADGSAMARERGGVQYQVAYYGTPTGYTDFIKDLPLAPGRGSVVGRVLLTRRPVQIADASTDAEYTHHNIQEFIGFRTLLGVPLLREGHPIGVFVLWRRAVQPFNERQVELVTTFADQAVIAIENTRLFDEIQDKTRQLEIADKYKSHFLASASHDLRQPLHALNLFVAQLGTETDPVERERIVTRIDAAVSSMNELFESLLDMAKLEAGILEPHLTNFPLQRVFRNIETTFADAARQKNLRLVAVPSSVWVQSDIILFERILMNFVSNAVRYTTTGRIVIGCRLRAGEVRIDVHDSGPGIPDEQQRNIFAEYYRLYAAEQHGAGGFGLGLAIVDRLGRLLNHPVELESHVGRGSRFSISVPLATGRGNVTEVPSVATLADPAQGKVVVVIDDDALVLDGMGGMLRSWGCEVLTADSVETALAKIAAQIKCPDLIISDYRLTNGRTGIEAVERVRRAQGVSIPAFLISGDTAPERLRDASANGFHLLHKPVAPMRLRAVLNQLLMKHSAPRGATPVGK